VLINPGDLEKLIFENGDTFMETAAGKVQVKGLVHVQILCPELTIPFLQYRYVAVAI
jgi:hypothetical protein